MRRLEARLIAHQLRDGRVIGRGQALGRGSAIEQELGCIQLRGGFGELPLEALEFGERAAELAALQHVRTRYFEGMAPDRERARRIADSLNVEAGDLLLEPPFAEQQVARRDDAILEVELAPLLAAHEQRGPA